MRTLARLGRDLHTALFRRRRSSSIAEVGRLLGTIPPSEGSTVQISVHPDASEFVFPWALIYDGQLPDSQWTAPPADAFWGVRYCIEQRLPGLPPRPQHTTRANGRPINLAYMLWDQFANAGQHTAMVTALTSERMTVSTPPIVRARQAAEVMESDENPDILYFFAHAHTRQYDNEIGRQIQAVLKTMPAGSSAESAFRQLYERISMEVDEPSWVKLTHGRLQLNDLYASSIEFSRAPLVILNACESAQQTPALTGESFVDFFLDRGAGAFVGTECMMTVVFAHSFAGHLLRQIRGGNSIGTALLSARRHFIELGNPLGLAYSLYGSSDLSFPVRSS